MKKYKNHIVITPQMHKALLDHKNRTGMGAIAIYKYMGAQELLLQCEHLSVQRIDSWFTKSAQKAVEGDFKAVMGAYKSITKADIKRVIPRCGSLRENVTQEFIDKLNQAFEKRPNFSRKLLLRRKDAPADLTVTKLSNIRSGRTKTMPKRHMDFLKKVISASLQKDILLASKEEADDIAYQKELNEWSG